MKFVQPLDEKTRVRLHQLLRQSRSARERQRAHGVLLSEKRYRIDQIADIFFVDRDTVSRWLDVWKAEGFEGLKDAPRPGRPPKLSGREQDQALEMVLEEPRQIKSGLLRISERYGKQFSLDWLRALLRRSGYRYKRCRTAPPRERDAAAFSKAQAELARLHEQEARGQIDLYYFDEAGFALRPAVPYAWQPVGKRLKLKQTGGKQLNVLGLMRRSFGTDESFVPFVTESSVTSLAVIACLDHFAARLKRLTVVVLDNAPSHTSRAFSQARSRWKEQGLELYFLPAYSPELNLIEHLWKHIKHYWMPISAYESFTALKAALEEVLVGIGTKYRITFA